MQHDVFVQPIRRLSPDYPFIAVLKSDYASGAARLCAPLIPLRLAPVSRAAPLITLDDRQFSLALLRIGAVPIRLLRQPVSSIAAYRDEITRALDWLFTGI